MVGNIQSDAVLRFSERRDGRGLEGRQAEDLQERVVIPECRPRLIRRARIHCRMQHHEARQHRSQPDGCSRSPLRTAATALLVHLCHRYHRTNARPNAETPVNRGFRVESMFTHIRRLVLAVFVLSTTTLIVAAEPLPDFEARYTVRYGPLKGLMVLRLSRYGNGYTYEASLEPKGLASLFARGMIYETTNLIDDGVTVRPVDYTSIDRIADPVRTTRYFFSDERVAGNYKGRQIELPMRAGGHNRISVHVALMIALRRGVDINGFPIFDRAQWKEYRFQVVPHQIVKTASGKFDTIEVRYTSSDGRKGSSLYFAPSLSYLPVMVAYREGDNVKSHAQLAEYKIKGFVDSGGPNQKRHKIPSEGTIGSHVPSSLTSN